jgi:hypothetical protein
VYYNLDSNLRTDGISHLENPEEVEVSHDESSESSNSFLFLPTKIGAYGQDRDTLIAD